MIEIQAHCPEPRQVGAHLRVVSPLCALRREHWGEMRVTYEKSADLHCLMQADIVFMQRPFSSLCVKRARLAHLAGAKVWLDWDDDLTAVSKQNRAWPHYQFPELLSNLDELCDLADVITVTTTRLAEVFGKHPEKVRFLPNAIEDRLIPAAPPKPRVKTIMWRGSDSHMEDLSIFRPKFTGFASVHSPEWKFCFVGKDPSIALQGLPAEAWRHIPELDYYELVEMQQKFAAPIHIVPLSDTPFNRAKSNLAYLEASLAGSAVIAPDWEEWQLPGVIHYSSPGHFRKQLEWAVENLDECRERNAAAFEYVKENHSLSKVNKIRWDIIQTLMWG